jgi:hypothetical protein
MRRVTLNFIVDLLGFVDLLLLTATGAIMKWVLPPGTGAGRGYGYRGGRGPLPADQIREVFGLGRRDWGNIHFVLASVFIFLILVHIVLHWTWVRSYVKLVLFRSRQAGQSPAADS